MKTTLNLPNKIDGWADLNYSGCLPPDVRIIHYRIICAGGCIPFSYSGSGIPSQWEWSFQGGVPASSNSRDPGTICFKDTGRFTIRLIVSNLNGRDTSLSTLHVVAPPVIELGANATI